MHFGEHEFTSFELMAPPRELAIILYTVAYRERRKTSGARPSKVTHRLTISFQAVQSQAENVPESPKLFSQHPKPLGTAHDIQQVLRLSV